MSLFIMLWRKMARNGWLYVCLLAGLIIAAALAASIPIYTEGILNAMLVDEMQQEQYRTGHFPGSYSIWFSWDDDAVWNEFRQTHSEESQFFKDQTVLNHYKRTFDSFNEINKYAREQAIDKNKTPLLDYNVSYSTAMLRLEHEQGEERSSRRNSIRLQSISDLTEHIKLLDGRLPSEKKVDGIFEVLVTQNVLMDFGLFLGETYKLIDRRYGGFDEIKVQPVGVFTLKDGGDPYWIGMVPEFRFADSFVMHQELMRSALIESIPTRIKSARWTYHINYHELTVDKLRFLLQTHADNYGALRKISPDIEFDIPGLRVFNSFFQMEREIILLLQTLYVPIGVMLLLFTLMLCRLIIASEKNELAVIGSRGGSRKQIVFIYTIQGIILSVIALLIGPSLGLILSKALGATSGFLMFVQRESIVADVGQDAYLYALLVLIPFFIMFVMTARNAGTESIVGHKRNVSRLIKAGWQKWYPDVLLLAIAAYGYYQFEVRQDLIRVAGTAATHLVVDPLLFLVVPMFILGAFLLFLRVYPWLVQAVFLAGKYIWKPGSFVALIQMARNNGRYQFIMLFLAMTISVGIFSATAARTINRNYEDRIWYSSGACMIITPVWISDAPTQGPVLGPDTDNNVLRGDETDDLRRISYTEPPFLPFTQLSGVEHAAKVFDKDRTTVVNDGDFEVRNVKLMGIEPYDFGKTAWFRDDLLPHHINEYLNLLTFSPNAVLISETLARNGSIDVGDSIRMSWEGTRKSTFTVVGIVEHWPTFNPFSKAGLHEEPMLVVANLSYNQTHLGLEPYRIWLRLKPDATTREVYDDIAKKNLYISHITNTRENVTDLKRSPSLMAINGALTFGFLLSIAVCFSGSLLFWMLELRSRILQFGILRAIGLRRRALAGILALEQILTSGIAIIGGLLIGFVSSALFVPFFQLGIDAVFQVPPFKIMLYRQDLNNIYIAIGITLIVILVLLVLILRSLRIHHVLKLGED